MSSNKGSKNTNSSNKLTAFLWISAAALSIGLLFARVVYPELLWLTAVVGLPLFASLGMLIVHYQQALRSRSAAYGINSFITVLLVTAILGFLNFFVSRYPQKWDLTKNKAHTLSDQTTKVLKSLKEEIKVTYFATPQQQEQSRALLDNYKTSTPKFELEYVNPNHEPTRTKQMGVKVDGTLILTKGDRENRVDNLTEEKVTNTLIKLLKDKTPTFCVTTGHGEKSFTSKEADGYDTIKETLSDQSYETKEVSLVEGNKSLEQCDALAIVGPTKSFFEPEVKAIQEYLAQGGRAIIAVDLNLKGGEYAPELLPILEEWHVKPGRSLVVDPFSRMYGVDASVAVLANFSKENPITQDLDQINNCAFPLVRPLEIIPSAPADLKANWIAQTGPKSWGVADLKSLEKGAIQFVAGKDQQGPLNAAIAVEGKLKDSKAPKNTRLVVFGTSIFATNNFSRYARNLDIFVNAVSWVMEDESLISIRTKEETPSKIELSQKAGSSIFLLTVIILPLLTAMGGIGVWVYRRRL
jgi:ABC-type uncharacterized transport system involved in gliding motility auxiliary subunit